MFSLKIKVGEEEIVTSIPSAPVPHMQILHDGRIFQVIVVAFDTSKCEYIASCLEEEK